MYELIDERVEKVLKNISSFSGKNTYIDSVKLANFFGFKVKLSDNMMGTSKVKLIVSEDGNKEIFVNSLYVKASNRISIAECVSYYLLYYDGNGEFSYIANDDDDEKSEYASYFARCLLMPKEQFSKIYESLLEEETYRSVVDDLEIIYLVPNEEILKRIQDIAYIGKRKIKI